MDDCANKVWGCSIVDNVDGQCRGGTAKDVATVARGSLLMLDGLLHFDGPGLPGGSGLGGRSKSIPIKEELLKFAGGEERRGGNATS